MTRKHRYIITAEFKKIGKSGARFGVAVVKKGIAMRAGDYLTIPLCYECHQGKLGIHGDKTYLKIFKMSELDLLNETIKRVYKVVA